MRQRELESEEKDLALLEMSPDSDVDCPQNTIGGSTHDRLDQLTHHLTSRHDPLEADPVSTPAISIGETFSPLSAKDSMSQETFPQAYLAYNSLLDDRNVGLRLVPDSSSSVAAHVASGDDSTTLCHQNYLPSSLQDTTTIPETIVARITRNVLSTLGEIYPSTNVDSIADAIIHSIKSIIVGQNIASLSSTTIADSHKISPCESNELSASQYAELEELFLLNDGSFQD